MSGLKGFEDASVLGRLCRNHGVWLAEYAH